MKVFQIIDGFCHWDASAVLRRAADAEGRFEPELIFADAPDYVYEGWGFDASAEGDERFIKPEAPKDGCTMPEQVRSMRLAQILRLRCAMCGTSLPKLMQRG